MAHPAIWFGDCHPLFAIERMGFSKVLVKLADLRVRLISCVFPYFRFKEVIAVRGIVLPELTRHDTFCDFFVGGFHADRQRNGTIFDGRFFRLKQAVVN
ncbi:hypothetical protein GUY47_14600 [Enterobacter hormaechei]|nr:hypothetical protein GUY47_14600 [Enterobacter hormaechei]